MRRSLRSSGATSRRLVMPENERLGTPHCDGSVATPLIPAMPAMLMESANRFRIPVLDRVAVTWKLCIDRPRRTFNETGTDHVDPLLVPPSNGNTLTTSEKVLRY